MSDDLILASGSVTRAQLLRSAGLTISVHPARVDEDNLKAALHAESLAPRDIADALADAKADKVARRHPEARVLGCDQTLDLDGALFDKPRNIDEARHHLQRLRGKTHKLHSAAVLYEEGRPVWRQVTTARLAMRPFSDAFLQGYLARNWPGIGDSVGGYKLEEEGVRLFDRIDGDHFTILGLPLLPLLNFLSIRGTIPA